MDQKLIQNTKEQFSRLISQLNELEEFKDELDPQDYQNQKQETLDQLKDFQESLQKIQSGEKSFLSEVEKYKQQIQKAIKDSFNVEEIKNVIQNNQCKQIREEILQIERDYKLNQIDQMQYQQKLLNKLNILQKENQVLTQNEHKMLDNLTDINTFTQNQQNIQTLSQINLQKKIEKQ